MLSILVFIVRLSLVHPLLLLGCRLFLLRQLALVLLYIYGLFLLLVWQRVSSYIAPLVLSDAADAKCFSNLTHKGPVLLRERIWAYLLLQMAKDIVSSLQLLSHGALGLFAHFLLQSTKLSILCYDLYFKVLFTLFHLTELESEIAFACTVLGPLVCEIVTLETFARLRRVLGRLSLTRRAHWSL